MQPGFVVVEYETDRLNAEVVAGFLKSEGIDARVNADDAAGTIPSLDETRFAQVLVPEADAERARELIARYADGVPADEDEDTAS